MLRRKLLITALLSSTVLVLAACGPKAGESGQTLRVGATAVPHAEILEHVKPLLAAQGVDLQIVVFNDYVQPNVQLAEGRLEANYFQTKPYLDEFNASRGASLVTVQGVHVEPLGAYSRRYKVLADLPRGADVVLPNDASNTGRSLLLLQKAGLIRLARGDNPLQTLADIAGNPKALKFRELEAATLPRILGQIDLAVINTNYALDAGLKPRQDALVLEGGDSPYVNYLVARRETVDDPRVKALAVALGGAEVRAFIENKYQGAVVPAAGGE